MNSPQYCLQSFNFLTILYVAPDRQIYPREEKKTIKEKKL